MLGVEQQLKGGGYGKSKKEAMSHDQGRQRLDDDMNHGSMARASQINDLHQSFTIIV